jgi:hypothetical protein
VLTSPPMRKIVGYVNDGLRSDILREIWVEPPPCAVRGITPDTAIETPPDQDKVFYYVEWTQDRAKALGWAIAAEEEEQRLWRDALQKAEDAAIRARVQVRACEVSITLYKDELQKLAAGGEG